MGQRQQYHRQRRFPVRQTARVVTAWPAPTGPSTGSSTGSGHVRLSARIEGSAERADGESEGMPTTLTQTQTAPGPVAQVDASDPWVRTTAWLCGVTAATLLLLAVL